MTHDPVCCTPDDTVVRAAQIMRTEDVGAVPVVADPTSRRLIGIVTDRDLAIKSVAGGHDPHTMRVEAAMSRALVTGRPDDDVQDAVNRMSRNQVRRLPIVDRNNCLIGIVTQADVAQSVDRHDVGQMVSEVSESDRPGVGRVLGRREPREMTSDERSTDGTSILVSLACLATGAGLMFLLDPARGSYRRRAVRDKAVRLYNSAGDTIGGTTRDLTNRTSGFMSEAASYVTAGEPVSDDKLMQRIRARLGHEVSHPHAIDISVRDGCVAVSGPVREQEVDALISTVRSVPGVRNVESRLEVHPREAEPRSV